MSAWHNGRNIQTIDQMFAEQDKKTEQLEAENERLCADLDAEKERSQELSQDKERWYRICELHATRLDSYQKAMRQAMSMLDQAEPRPEAAFSTLLLALNPDLESAKNLAAKENV